MDWTWRNATPNSMIPNRKMASTGKSNANSTAEAPPSRWRRLRFDGLGREPLELVGDPPRRPGLARGSSDASFDRASLRHPDLPGWGEVDSRTAVSPGASPKRTSCGREKEGNRAGKWTIPRLRDVSDRRRLAATWERGWHPRARRSSCRSASRRTGRNRSATASLLDALDLGRGRWVLVLETKPGLLTSAVVEELEGFRRARAGDGVSEGLLAKTASGEGRGSFTFRRLGTIGPWSGERPIEVDQSNESVVVGGRPS